MILGTDVVTTIAVLTPAIVAVGALFRYLARFLLVLNEALAAIKKHGIAIEKLAESINEHEAKDQQIQRELTDRLAITGQTLARAAETVAAAGNGESKGVESAHD